MSKPTRRQIVLNWLMGEDDYGIRSDGWWATSEGIAAVDGLLAALDASHDSKSGGEISFETGCEEHRDFRSSGPFCPICLRSERDELAKLLSASTEARREACGEIGDLRHKLVMAQSELRDATQLTSAIAGAFIECGDGWVKLQMLSPAAVALFAAFSEVHKPWPTVPPLPDGVVQGRDWPDAYRTCDKCAAIYPADEAHECHSEGDV